MIYLDKIYIHEFRGIRDLEFSLGGKNFAVCGPNGTGKSGVVDAIEFALTGNISRLTGKGSGDLSIKDHAPHVDSSKKPEESYVTLTFKFSSSNQEITIKRDVKNKSKPTITPDNSETAKVLEYIKDHPEFVLSRREIIRYVMVEPGKRSEEVQSLLKLEKIDKLRSVFQKLVNNYEKEVKVLENQKAAKREELKQALGITQFSTALLLEEVNKRRKVLSLAEINELESDTSIKDGLTTSGTPTTANTRIPKKQACDDISSLEIKLEEISKINFQILCKEALLSIKKLNEDDSNIKNLAKESLVRTSLEIFEGDSCPVCDTEWNPNEFQDLLNKKLENCKEIKKQKTACEDNLKPIAEKLFGTASLIELVSKYCPLLSRPIEVKPLEDLSNSLTSICTKLKNFLPIEETISVLENYEDLPYQTAELVKQIATEIRSIPEPTDQEKARDYLVVGQDRLESYRKISKELDVAKARLQTVEKICEKYNQVTTEKLEEIYKDVEKSFRSLYRIINKDDESTFTAELTPSNGKLGFNVDFYGRGKFPPGAYHSEGHQDGMGLCLYLALMKHLLGKNFTLAVLDDVLMSVDSGHRREVCTLLKQEFPNTQFILTTHDDIWLRHMDTAGLIGKNNFMHFRTWSVDQGPTEWDDRNVWQEIDDNLKRNDVRAASSLLRHYLEYISKEICHRLKASVPFSGDAQYTLGDLLPPGVKKFKKIIKEGKSVAISWGQKNKESEIIEYEKAIEAASEKSNVERWQVNASVHYNEWASLSANDFKPVVEAHKNLLKHFECSSCNEILSADKQSLRCSCGTTNINLVKKTG